MDEEKLDRRAHWVQWIAGGVVGATIFCVTIKLTLTQLEQDFKEYKQEMKRTMKELDNRIDDIHDHQLILETQLKEK